MQGQAWATNWVCSVSSVGHFIPFSTSQWDTSEISWVHPWHNTPLCPIRTQNKATRATCSHTLNYEEPVTPVSPPPQQHPHTRNGLTCDDPGDTAKAIPHAESLSFSTELNLKQLLLLPLVAFYLAIFKHQSNHSTPAIKMQWTQYLLYTILRNYNSTSPQSLNKMDGQPLNKRCSRFGKKLSHFTSPHMCHITEPGYSALQDFL